MNDKERVMTVSLFLAKQYNALKFGDLTPKSVDTAKQVILDYLGCAYAGVSYESSQILREYTLENYAPGPCTLIGHDQGLVPAGAAFINAATGHTVELDDCTNEGGGHPGVTIVPVALAMGEYAGGSGKDLLRSIVIGYDTFIRIGKASNYDSCFERGFHPTALFGMFGAAMTGARLLGLSTEKTVNAMGIVGSYVAGNLECYSDGSLTKRLQPGIAASSGITAALLAGKGYTGPKTILEGPRGFYNGYCKGATPDDLQKEMGEFEIEAVSFKPHACCRFNQAGIDAALAIQAEHGVTPDSIRSISIELPERPYNIVGQPDEIKRYPNNAVAGQFSAAYSVAICLLEGKALLKEYTDESVRRPDVAEMIGKIKVRHAFDLDGYFPESFPTRLSVTMNNGNTFVKEVRYPKGDPENPLTWDELLAKFDYCTSDFLGSENRQKIVDALQALEKIENVSEFTELLG